MRDANILAVEKEIVHLTFTEKCENKLKTKQKNSQSQRNFLFFFHEHYYQIDFCLLLFDSIPDIVKRSFHHILPLLVLINFRFFSHINIYYY